MRITTMLLLLTGFTIAATRAQSGETDEMGLRRACLDTVWQTVSECHYDSTFGGINWKGIHERYAELAATVENDDAFLKLMNKMLLELNLSHYAVFRKEAESASGSRAFSEGSIGIDVRLLDSEAVITSVTPEFPASQLGLRPGFVIRKFNGTSVLQLLSDWEAVQVPFVNERRRIAKRCRQVVNHCFGQPGDTVVVTYEDEAGVCRDAKLWLKVRSEGHDIGEGFPSGYTDFKAEHLAGDIGYISFSSFFPPVDSLFLSAMETMGDVRGLIIDIRGNPGGSHEIGEAIAAKLLSEKTLFSVFRYRDSTVRVSVDPDPPVFKAPTAILINVMSGSASERFAACMQSIGRAKIIGEQSSGSVGPSDLKILPNGASFLYLQAQSLTPDGTILEGRGVIPDIAVPLDRKALLKGIDTQLEQAIACLEREID